MAINSILNARVDGPFKDLGDFISRIDGSKVNKRVIESLTKAGAFDSFGYSRRALLEQIEKIVETVGKAATAKKWLLVPFLEIVMNLQNRNWTWAYPWIWI